MADLRVGEVNSRQIVGLLADLDASYGEEGRIATWTCFLTSSGEKVEEAFIAIPAYATTTSYIFSNLTPATSYIIQVVVSGIIGSADRTFRVQQNTATSGGIDYGKIPHIRKFLAEREGIAIPKIRCYLHITNLVANDNYVSVAVYDSMDRLITSTDKVYSSNEVDQHIVLPDNDTDETLKYDEEYTVRLFVTNNGFKTQEATATITLLESPVSLFCFFEDKVLSVNGGKSSVTVYDYPIMNATSFNDFWAIVNAVRVASGLNAVSGVNVDVGSPMDYSCFAALCRAIDEVYDKVVLPKPINFINAYSMFLGEGKTIRVEVINGIETGLQQLYNHLLK